MDFRGKAQLLIISGFKIDDFYISNSEKIYVVNRGSNFISFSDGNKIFISKSSSGIYYLKGKKLDVILNNIGECLKQEEYLKQ